MVTGIDETGDFNALSNEINFFTAVHIDQNANKYEQKRDQFKSWEDSIPDRFKTASKEIKGNNLTDDYIESFSSMVLEPEPKLLFSAVRIRPALSTIGKIHLQRNEEINNIAKVIKQAEAAGNKSWSDGYTQIIKWYKNRTDSELLKIKCLSRILGISFNRVFGWAQITYLVENDVRNIANICFKIDKDFIRPPHGKIIWNELFRQAWNYNYTSKEPIPIVPMGDKKNPAFEIYKLEEGKLIVSEVFKKRTEFLDSKETWEVRMADLTGTILHRYLNKNRCQTSGKVLMQHLSAKQGNYEEIILR